MYSALLSWKVNFVLSKVFLWARGVIAILPTLEKKAPAIFRLMPKSPEFLVSPKHFSSNCSAGHAECLSGSSKFLLKFFRYAKFNFDTLVEFFPKKSKILPSKIEKGLKIDFFFLTIFVRTHGRRFWQLCWKI